MCNFSFGEDCIQLHIFKVFRWFSWFILILNESYPLSSAVGMVLFAHWIKPRSNKLTKHFRSKSISFNYPSCPPSLALLPHRDWSILGFAVSSPKPSSASRSPPKSRQVRVLSWRRAVACRTGMSVTSDLMFSLPWKLTLCKPLLFSSLSHRLWSALMVFPMVPLPPIRISRRGARDLHT